MVELEIGDPVESFDELSLGDVDSARGSTATNGQLVREVDVKRGREVIEAHSGSAGSICLVVRRPG